MLKILWARLPQYVNHELPDVQAGFRKGRGTRDHIANIRWIIKKARVPEKHLLYWLCQSLCREGNGTPLQYSWLENPMDGGAWKAAVHGVTEGWTRLKWLGSSSSKAFDCVDHNKLWKILKEMGIPDHLTCLLRNLYADQEATVKTGHGTTDWFQIGKGVRQGCILSPYLFNLYAEYIMRNTRLDEAQAGIRIAG